jgi:hypothetical protein
VPHRDDVEAARARSDALAREVEELKAERDALARENERLAKGAAEKKPAPALAPEESAKPDPGAREAKRERNVRVTGFVIGGTLIVGLATLVHHNARETARKKADYESARAEYEHVQNQWRYAQRFEPCVRRAEVGAASLRERIPATWGESQPRIEAPRSQCTDDAKHLGDDPSLPDAARAALLGWSAAEADLDVKSVRFNDYFSARDFKEDQYRRAPQLWADVSAALGAQRLAAIALARDAFPAIRAHLRDNQLREEKLHGKTNAWWSIEVGLELWQLGEVAIGASGIRDDQRIDREAVRVAIRTPTASWVLHAQSAPIEVRRIVRGADFWTEPLDHGGPLRDEILWDVISPDIDPIGKLGDVPGLPPEPRPPPDDD